MIGRHQEPRGDPNRHQIRDVPGRAPEIAIGRIWYGWFVVIMWTGIHSEEQQSCRRSTADDHSMTNRSNRGYGIGVAGTGSLLAQMFLSVFVGEHTPPVFLEYGVSGVVLATLCCVGWTKNASKTKACGGLEQEKRGVFGEVRIKCEGMRLDRVQRASKATVHRPRPS